MYFGASVLILDEPTSALGVHEAAIVLRLVAQARADGLAIIFITHNVTHAIAIGDRFTVLQHGRNYADARRGEITRDKLIGLMAGSEEEPSLVHFDLGPDESQDQSIEFPSEDALGGSLPDRSEDLRSGP
jgi:simple sugar transport system ATP-binding protein